MGMDQYLLIQVLGEWTSIYQLFWCSPGVQDFDTLPSINGWELGVPTFMESPVFSVDMLILFLHETGWQGANFIAFPAWVWRDSLCERAALNPGIGSHWSILWGGLSVGELPSGNLRWKMDHRINTWQNDIPWHTYQTLIKLVIFHN